MTSEYKHPDGGRVYREGDPAHYFATMALSLRRLAEDYIYHYDRRMVSKDYLTQHQIWTSDPGRIAQHMADLVKSMDEAYNKVNAEKYAPSYGLGKYDEEWDRKYGESQ